MHQIKRRHVPTFFEVEHSLNRADVMALLGNASKGSFWDKVRLAASYILGSPSGLAEFEEVKKALLDAASLIPVGAGYVRVGVVARPDNVPAL
jgi:hypothetical protein